VTTIVAARAIRVRALVRRGSAVKVTLDCTASGRLALLTGHGRTVHAFQSFACGPSGTATTTFHLSKADERRAGHQTLRVSYIINLQIGS
jgi:hypothetical protein